LRNGNWRSLELEARILLDRAAFALALRDAGDAAWADLALREFLEDLAIRAARKRGKGSGKGLDKHPPSAVFKTPSAKYSGAEVNAAAKQALKHAQAGTKDRGYPKAGSGFRRSEAKADPTRGRGPAIHAPIAKKGAPFPGPDRVVVHKPPGKARFRSTVAFHDPKKPVPTQTGSKNHPFSGGKKKYNGKSK